jgi:hypothetical protein
MQWHRERNELDLECAQLTLTRSSFATRAAVAVQPHCPRQLPGEAQKQRRLPREAARVPMTPWRSMSGC